MTSTHAFWLAGRLATGEDSFDVHSPWDGRLVGSVSVPTDAQVEEAVAAAHAVTAEFSATPPTYGPPPWTTCPSGSPSAPRRSPS